MMNQIYNQPAPGAGMNPQPQIPVGIVPKSRVTEVILAVALFLISFSGVYIFLFGLLGTGLYLCYLALLAAGVVFLLNMRAKPVAATWVYPVLGAVYSLSFVLCGNAFLRFLSFQFLLLLTAYWMYAACGCRVARRPVDRLFFDLPLAVFAVPFPSFGSIFGAFSGKEGVRKHGRTIGVALIGLLVTFPVVVIVTGLLLSADAAFAGMTSSLFFELFNSKTIVCLILAVPTACYLFGMMAGSRRRGTLGHALTKKTAYSGACQPSAVYAALTPVLFVYVIYFFSQLAYFVSAFSSYLPKDYTYAEFARRGFFELCAVAVINAFLMLAAALLVRRKDGEISLALRIYLTLYSVCSLVLIACAFSKMYLYISQFGLTRLRVYTTWFMLLLAICFLVVLLYQWVRCIRPVPLLTGVFAVWFAVLTLFNVDGGIAAFNAYGYQSGIYQSLDISLFDELGDAAVPTAAKLVDDPAVGKEICAFLTSAAEEHTARKSAGGIEAVLLGQTLVYRQADRILNQLIADGVITALPDSESVDD